MHGGGDDGGVAVRGEGCMHGGGSGRRRLWWFWCVGGRDHGGGGMWGEWNKAVQYMKDD